MSSTLRTLGAGALGALLVAVTVLALRPTPVVGAPATDTTPAQHTITVSGSGKVTIVPDVARITLGVTISKPTVKAVRDAGAKAMTDVIAERVRKIGGLTLHSVGEVARTQRVLDNDAEYVEPAGHACRAARGQQDTCVTTARGSQRL